MAEGMAIAGLASSIVSFLGVSYEVCKRAKEFSRTARQLPTDVKSAKDLLYVITRSAERLPARLGTFAAGNPVFGPPTEQEVDLMGLFDKLTVLSTDLLRVIDKLDNAHNVMSKALLSIRKEKKVENIREELNRCILAINFLLSEGIHASVGEVSDIAAELRKQHLEFHQRLEQNMSAGFQALGNDVCNSHNKLLEEFRNLMANQEKVVAASHLDVILGQRDIAQNLDAIIRLIARSKSDIKEELAGDMERSLLKQRDITREMLKLTVKEVNSSMIIQTQALMHEMLESSIKHSNSRGLARVSGDALDNITKGETNDIYLRVNFEFRFHSEVLVIHVTRCIEWAASRFALFSVPKFTFNFPYYKKRKTGETELHLGPQCALYDKFEVNITYEYRIRGQYQRIRVILEKEKVKEDLATAAELSSRELDLFWPPLLPRPLRKLSYTECYSSVNIKQSIHMERRDPPQTFRSNMRLWFLYILFLLIL